MKFFIFIICLGYTLFKALDGREVISLTSNQANDFMSVLRRSKRNLYHECYVEGCDREEVEEVFGRNERTKEYYYDYTCRRFRKSCKVKCSYRQNCLFHWSSWVGNYKGYSECYTQKRYKYYVYPIETYYTRWGCRGLNTCSKSRRVESRLNCVCKKAQCYPAQWSSWSGAIRQGECVRQRREQPFSVSWTTVAQIGSCDNIPKKCNPPIIDIRKRCSCKKAVCSLGSWSKWSGSVSQGKCGQQTRTKSYDKSFVYEERNDCSGISQNCPSALTEKREFCICSYRDSCILKKYWGIWRDDVTEEGCKIQTRTRSYVSPLKHIQSDSCKGMNAKCTEEPKETRTYCKCKYVKCELGDWSNWSKLDVSEGSCGEQTRTQSYRPKEAFLHQEGDCDGVRTVCPEDKREKRFNCNGCE